MRRRFSVTFGVLASLWPVVTMAISAPRLVADFATATSPNDGSEPAEFVRVGSHLLFTARPDGHARRLFRSDGTPAGTEQIASACGALDDGGFSLRFATAERAYYAASCAGGAEALWSSDGTVAGTRVVLSPGAYRSPGPALDLPQWAVDGEQEFFLQGGNYASRLELWRTDGTPDGSESLGEVSVGESITAALFRRGPGDLLLLVEERFESVSLWRSDGTAAGTSKVQTLDFLGQYSHLRSVAPTANGIALLVALREPSRTELWHADGTAAGAGRLGEFSYGLTDLLAARDGAVFFVATEGGQAQIWRSDGTVTTTRPIVDLAGAQGLPAITASSGSFHFLAGHVYLVACTTDRRVCALLRAPLAGGEAERIAVVCSAQYCDASESALWVRSAGGRLVYTKKSDSEVTVWTSTADGLDAAEAATLCAAESCFGPSAEPLALDSAVFFAAVADTGGSRELWSSDGTPGGTLRLAGPLPSIGWYGYANSWEPLAALPEGQGWLFAAADAEHGLELWRARPQADSGAMVEDLRADRPGLLNAESVGAVGSTFVFALTSEDGDERTLYRHAIADGAPEPFLAVPVHHGRHGLRNAPPALRPAGNAWFFIEYDLGDEYSFAGQIWRYDPVSRDLRTLFAEDPQVTGIGARADDLVPSGADFLFLGSIDLELHPAIYRLRPRSGAISKLMDLPAQSAISVGRSGDFWYLIENGERVVAIDLNRRTRTVLGEYPGAFVGQAVALADGVIFSVDRQASGEGTGLELWQCSGVDARVVAQWPSTVDGCEFYLELPPRESASPALFAAQTHCSVQTAELWVSDGSFDRTRLLRSFPGEHLDFARAADRLRGSLYFLASSYEEATSPARYAIWKTDATAAGTQPVAELPAEPYSGTYNFTAAAVGEAAIYFAWSDLVHGTELWRTDGTAAGTGLAADIEPGPESSSPWQLRTVGDQVIFRAGTAAAGLELWQVDGGFHLAQLVADLFPGIESSAPLMLGSTAEALYFLADDGVVGREIWEVDHPSVARCGADETTLCLAEGRFRARAVRRDFAGELGTAGVVPLTGDSGYFWFFSPGNPEVLLKIVDACGLPGFENFWVYSTGLTNVEVELEVVDTISGARKIVHTALGEAYGPLFDSGSFEVCGVGGASPVAPPDLDVPPGTGSVLPLLAGRFEARATWKKHDGTSGIGSAVPLASDSGYFWFFAPSIVEVLVKMVDACGFDGFDNFWVFAGGLTDVEVHLTVTDTWSGQVVHHDNPQGQPFPTLLETGKLRVCR